MSIAEDRYAPEPAPATRSPVAGAPTILFQAHNRRGLGHLMRALNVAREIRALAPDARIVVHSRNPSAAGFCPPDVEWIADADAGGMSWRAALETVAPGVVVYDTLVPEDPATEPIPPDARVAYVMRRSTDERHQVILDGGFLDRVDVVIVPHDRDEFDRPVPTWLEPRLVFAGPIVRAPDPARAARLQARYGLDGASQVVVSSAGGGGFVETAEPFFDAVWAAHERLARDPGLRHVAVLGPHNAGRRATPEGMQAVASEPDLVDLFSIADLVVSEAGYNSVNEVRLVAAPACFVPGARRWDDQAQRVRALEARGLAVVIPPAAPAEMGAAIASVARDRDRLAALRRRNLERPLRPGNRRAAVAILDDAG
jgi:hypothetical protein